MINDKQKENRKDFKIIKNYLKRKKRQFKSQKIVFNIRNR